MRAATLFWLIALPFLIFGYVYTGIPVYAWIIPGIVTVSFILSAVGLLYACFAPLAIETRHKLREVYRKRRLRQAVAYVAQASLTIALFYYVNSYSGTTYLLSALMLLMARVKLLKCT